jgi:hypothetical protein
MNNLKTYYVVMSAITGPGKSPYETNAIVYDEEAAQRIADQRTAVEKKAGNNISWFVNTVPAEMQRMLAAIKG